MNDQLFPTTETSALEFMQHSVATSIKTDKNSHAIPTHLQVLSMLGFFSDKEVFPVFVEIRILWNVPLWLQ